MTRAWIYGAPLLGVLLLALIWGFPGAASGQSTAAGLPANASAKSYGDGWTCDRGYRAERGACQPIEVPANALATQTSYGRGWECRRGFREVNGACNAIEVPANGYLNAAEIGPGWKCERGFRATGDACIAIALPENAHIDYSGNDWECDHPYSKLPDGCVLR